MSLTDDLVSHWKLDEASGTRADSHGSNDLSDNNTVGSDTGKIGNAAQFVAASSEYLNCADNAGLSAGDVDFTIAGWIYFDSKPGTFPGIITKRTGGGGLEYYLGYAHSIDRIYFNVTQDGSANSTSAVADALGAPSTGTWYFVICWHDSVANTINIQVNDGSVNSQAYAFGVFDGGNDFFVGQSGSGAYFDGRIDSISFWKRVLTSDERTQLYNGGDGLDYDEFAPADDDAPMMLTRPRNLCGGFSGTNRLRKVG